MVPEGFGARFCHAVEGVLENASFAKKILFFQLFDLFEIVR